MKKKRKDDFEDDGRVIANMNVDGMPWYSGRSHLEKNTAKKTDLFGNGAAKDAFPQKMSWRDQLAVMGGVMKAALLVAVVFAVVFTVFILFCVFVWFK